MSDERDTELPPRLSCVGPVLVTPNGKPITLRGINLGAVGEDSPQDAVSIAALGANCARVALRWWGHHGDPSVDARDNDGFAFLRRSAFTDWLDKITACSQAGLWVVPFIDSNCGQSGMQNPQTVAYCDPHRTWGAAGRNFYTDASMRRLFTQIVWPAAAARLRTIARIAMLEVHPEPAPGRGPEYIALVERVQREAIEAIRAVDADTPFLLGARDAYDIQHCREAHLPERDDCVYTGNLLSQWVTNEDKFAKGLDALARMRQERNVPVFVQQLGRKSGNDRDLAHMRAALEKMEEADIGYAWWQWKQNTTSADDYGLNYKDPNGNGWVQKADEVAALEQAWEQ
jgi:Cellulase (glycosyl hydrolase family 5)